MVCVHMRWAAIFCVVAFTLPAWACFPAPDAKPKHEISVVELPRRLLGVVVTFESEGYALRASANDLLTVLSQPHMSVASPNDLPNALRAKMSLGQDFDARELIDVMISNADESATQDARSDQRYIAMHGIDKLRYAFASVLQEGKASVTEVSSEHLLSRLKLDRFSEICHGGRVFMSPDDKVVLRVNDWIS